MQEPSPKENWMKLRWHRIFVSVSSQASEAVPGSAWQARQARRVLGTPSGHPRARTTFARLFLERRSPASGRTDHVNDPLLPGNYGNLQGSQSFRNRNNERTLHFTRILQVRKGPSPLPDRRSRREKNSSQMAETRYTVHTTTRGRSCRKLRVFDVVTNSQTPLISWTQNRIHRVFRVPDSVQPGNRG